MRVYSCHVFSKKMRGGGLDPLDIFPRRCYCSVGARGCREDLKTSRALVYTNTQTAPVPQSPIADCTFPYFRSMCSSAPFGENREFAVTADVHRRESSRMPHCQYDRNPAGNRAEGFCGGGKP